VKVQRLSSTDGFIVWDLEASAMSAGIVRLAPKVLQDGAVLLARTTTYAFASFGLAGHDGASAGINAKPEDRDAAVAAFVDEVRPLAEEGRLRLAPGLGTTALDLAPLVWTEPDATRQAAGALAAAGAVLGDGGLDGRTAAVVGSGPVAAAAAEQLEQAGAGVLDPRFDTACDVLLVAGKAGVLDHDTAASVKSLAVVPLSPVPVTARALAVLGRAGCVVVPDFISTSAPLLAQHDPASGDPVERIGETIASLTTEGTGMWLAAATQAEGFLASWTKEKPFGRPLA
jgi:glutamate dehydrogenase/leucine dehydrogenase